MCRAGAIYPELTIEWAEYPIVSRSHRERILSVLYRYIVM